MKEVVAIVAQVEVESLSLKQIGVHVQALCRQTARNLWELGKALHHANLKVKERGGDWKAWLQKNCPNMPYSTLMRYKLLFDKNPTAKGIDQQTVTESYSKLGITNSNESREKRKEAMKKVATVADKLNDKVKDNPEALALVKQLLKQLDILNPKKKEQAK